TITDTCEEHMRKLAEKTVDLTRHHFTAIAQSAYLNNLKGSIDESQVIIQGDFAKNYSFIVQDAAQGFHWENSQATLHPFVVYHREQDGSLGHLNFCTISDSRTHNTATVYTFQSKLLEELKKM